ncbi:3,4-dihydroxy-2-butanone-4-phosphate synthase [Brevibacterium album]|uniref:3,4-dihydroxy-2-butanone-4-phosphate synthase n=1 Tax=Brevibacterium album TaxID=417948 RepID=UPI0004099A1C|nr:3,4-dihydroxy-2-butanone-4-phosphate synthase [Brevibacterium album]
MIRLDPIDAALASLRAGRPVVVVDDEDRENEGDLVMPALTATPAWMGFVVRHTSGVVCAPMPAARARALELPPMTAVNEDAKGTAYTVSCDAREGVTTGISAADRTVTAHALAAARPDPRALARPGHIFPLIARDGGVRERPGHTEAGVELCRLTGLGEVAIIAELVHDAGEMMRAPALREFADAHDLTMISIADLIAWLAARDAAEAEDATGAGAASGAAAGAEAQPAARDRAAQGSAAPVPAPVPAGDAGTPDIAVVGTAPVGLPTPHGTFVTRAWRELDSGGLPTGPEHLTLEAPGGTGDGPSRAADSSARLVRVHSECLTGDVLGSHRCDCGEQLEASLTALASAGGLLIYMRGHEGRGIGLWEKLRAYALQDSGADTVEANLRLGHPADARDYRAAAAILRELDRAEGTAAHGDLGRPVRLLTNNPEKISGLRALGIDVVERVPLEVPSRAENARYLATKRDRMHHLLSTAVLAPVS